MGSPRMKIWTTVIDVAAVRADEGRPPVVERILVLPGLLRRHLQQLACEGKIGVAAAVGQQAVVTDAVEAARQHMQQEAAHELAGLQRHRLVAGVALGSVVLPAEGDATLVQRESRLLEIATRCV